ncbi:unnamed protein product [Gongylonema pulchrum]|uniref:Uncharacterized protein n=1 Tax=Gongylonema pulchrum TaxID=637853 RepID=A0A183D4P6_9BILA|nr:unnamed protein product [Gongylonema pulchrum]
MEDKSALRKSILNMSEEDAKKARAAEEVTFFEQSRNKMRRLGTVSALSSKFVQPEIKPETYKYKRSPLLETKDGTWPKRTYAPVIKPEINDSFDKQAGCTKTFSTFQIQHHLFPFSKFVFMTNCYHRVSDIRGFKLLAFLEEENITALSTDKMEEIRAKMETGNTLLSNQFADLKRGIASLADDARRATLEEKHKQLLLEAGETFEKAGNDFKKWRENRTAEYQKELEKQEQELHRQKAQKTQPLAKAPAPVKKSLFLAFRTGLYSANSSFLMIQKL